LHFYHSNNGLFNGVNINKSLLIDIRESGIWDLFSSKYWAIKYSVETAITILTITHIIMAKTIKNGEEV